MIHNCSSHHASNGHSMLSGSRLSGTPNSLSPPSCGHLPEHRHKSLAPPNQTDKNHCGDLEPRRYLTDEELATFRTSVCPNIRHHGFCDKQDACPHSHCLAWQRRNPFAISYLPDLCPSISFVKQGGKMRLVNNCSHRRRCKYAHSKEESLYHPLTYKMKRCLVKPECNRHFCPFAHSDEELRDPNQVLYAIPCDGYAPSVSSQRSSPLIGSQSTPLKSPAPSYPVLPSPSMLSPALPAAASNLTSPGLAPLLQPPPGFTEEDRCFHDSAPFQRDSDLASRLPHFLSGSYSGDEPHVSVPLSVLLPFIMQGQKNMPAKDLDAPRITLAASSSPTSVPTNVTSTSVKSRSLFFTASESSSRSSSPASQGSGDPRDVSMSADVGGKWARVAAAFRE